MGKLGKLGLGFQSTPLVGKHGGETIWTLQRQNLARTQVEDFRRQLIAKRFKRLEGGHILKIMVPGEEGQEGEELKTSMFTESSVVVVDVVSIPPVAMRTSQPNRAFSNVQEQLFLGCQGDVDLVTRTLEAGADVNCHDKDGKSALCKAAGSARAETFDTLLKHGADLNLPGSERNTPLHFACKSGNTWAVRTLLQAGANKRLLNKDKKTPRDVAEKTLGKVFFFEIPSSCV